MNPILDWGLQVIRAVQQGLGTGLQPFFEGLSGLGSEQFFLLFIPLLFWSIDYAQAARFSLLFAISGYTNTIAKDLLMQPRPFELDPSVGLVGAQGYGFPSGHAQTAVVVWGVLASWVRSGWTWAAAAVLAFLIGLSRIYLGVHFPTDVLGGWLIGAVLLWLYLGQGARIERWLVRLPTYQLLLLGAGGALLLMLTHPVRDIVAVTGGLAGFTAGMPLTLRHLRFSAAGEVWQRALRFVLGAVALVLIYYGLTVLFPAEGEALYTPLRFLRYGIAGLWVSFGAPWLFLRLRLATTSVGSEGQA